MPVAAEVRAWRERCGLSIRGLAERADIAPSTVWRIEAGRLDPTVGMLARLRRATVGERSSVPTTREAAVSLALGRLTAAELLRNPEPVLVKARARVGRMLDERTLPHGTRRQLTEWSRILAGPLEDIVGALIDPSERGYELRQATPFTGLLSDEERLAAIRRATREHRATRAA